MNYYVWGLFHYPFPVPTGSVLQQFGDDECQFYPFTYTGEIFTVDSQLWGGEEQTEILHPDLIDLQYEIDVIEKNDMVNLVAISLLKHFPGFGNEVNVSLQCIPKGLIDLFFSKYVFLGIDIIDATGLSGIANIGYNSYQSECLRSLNIEPNQSGLVDKYTQAADLANAISEFVPEHSPFTPVYVWRRKG